jgi:hypothetical protein
MKAAHERDYRWLGDVFTKHYHGDDSDVKVMGGILRAFAGVTVEDYATGAAAFLGGPHPTIGRAYRECGYLPMIELLRYEYSSGAETSLERAANDGWTVVSIKNDWATVFADPSS